MANSFSDYRREIELVIRQNPLECELYSLIAPILRNANYLGNISIRDVTCLSQKGKTHHALDRQFDQGNGVFASPDFLIIDTRYQYSKRQKEYILGCCEVKAIYRDLDKAIADNERQFLGELSTYRKLLYTNGIEWRYYENEVYSKTRAYSWKIELGKYELHRQGLDTTISDQDVIHWNSNENWYDLLSKLKEIDWYAKR